LSNDEICRPTVLKHITSIKANFQKKSGTGIKPVNILEINTTVNKRPYNCSVPNETMTNQPKERNFNTRKFIELSTDKKQMSMF
jgi:hypothetical protein